MMETESGKVEVEDSRERTVVLKCGSEVKAERMEGPSLPPAPTRRIWSVWISRRPIYEKHNILRRMFLTCEDMIDMF